MIRKKGLSTVVTTLIIVLLVLAAIGIIWGPIQNLLKGGESAIDKTKCLNVDIRATGVVGNSTLGDYNVTLRRSATGEGDFGAKVLFLQSSGNASEIQSIDSGILKALEPKIEIYKGVLVDATKVEVTPFYLDAGGKEVICETTTSYEFSAAA